MIKAAGPFDYVKKTQLHGTFLWIGFNCLKATEPLRGGSLLFATKLTEILGTHLIGLGRTKAEATLEPRKYWFRIFAAEIVFAREFHWNSISGSMKNGERMVQLIQVTERILLLPWFQQIMIQVIQRYKTNDFLVRSIVSQIQVSKQIDP